MSNPMQPDLPPADANDESFADLLSRYEQGHARSKETGPRNLEGTVVAVTEENVVFDIGMKTEGSIPLAQMTAARLEPKPGDKFPVNIKGRDPEGFYELALGRVERPRDWSALEKAFAEKTIVMGTVTAVIKGGLSVDVGVRAFMPASRSGARDAAEMERLVGQEIRCRITKLDVADEDLVVDHRIVAEEEERAARQSRLAEIQEGETVTGHVRSLTDYGAFVDIGGVDGLLHVGDMAWSRVGKPADVVSVGQEIEVRVLKVDTERNRISLGLKQLQPYPWDSAAEKYKTGERVRGTVTRLADFGAFVELEPGIEGLIHLSELSWSRQVHKPEEVVKPGESVEAVILGVNAAERRISLGLKQALGDPWADVVRNYAPGLVVEGPVVSILKFGAFVQVAEGVEGMIHISDITAEKRLNHPQEMLKVGQVVKAQVLEIDAERRRLRLGMKQLVPTSLDEYLAEHKAGDRVSGRVMEISGGQARVELGEGIHATCRLPQAAAPQAKTPGAAKADLSSLTSMLQARWKGTASASAAPPPPEPVQAGQIRSFHITSLDAKSKAIQLELA
jgi:small subunit ribosomal protein S1